MNGDRSFQRPERGFHPQQPSEGQKGGVKAKACARVLVRCRTVFVRCCGQDCPRSEIGCNDGARVSTRSNERRGQEVRECQRRVRVRCGLLGRLLVFVRCCGQDCPRAGIGRNDGARVSTRSNDRRGKRGAQRPRARACAGGLLGRLLVFVRCCGQDCPRAGNGRNDGARVLTRSNDRRGKRGAKGQRRVRVRAGCRTPLGFRALLRTRLSARREWPQ